MAARRRDAVASGNYKVYAMTLKVLDRELSVCKLNDIHDLELSKPFYFVGKTDEELSLVCETTDEPSGITAREDGWRAFRVEGVLDFSLIGILAKLTGILADHGIGLFAVSTYNTDYILVKRENLAPALEALEGAGCDIVR